MPERFLTFSTNGQLYALPSGQVAEIIRLPAVARVPQAPKGLLGLANLRGNVLPVASLRGLLGVAEMELELYGEMHRFIPILAHQRGARCVEVVTRHYPRRLRPDQSTACRERFASCSI